MINIDKFIKNLLDKLNIEVDHYNQTCFDWSNGYRKAIMDVIEYLKNFKNKGDE